MTAERQEDVNAMFNREAKHFADSIQGQILDGKYYRGHLFETLLSEQLKPGADTLVLDYGCGVGSITKLIFDRGFRVEAYDPSSVNIDIAKAYRLPQERVSFHVLHDQGESLPDHRYEAVICSSVIEFVQDPDRLLAHFYRCLKPNGILLISFANKLSLWRLYAKIRFGKNEHYRFQNHVWTPVQFIRLLKKGGFMKTQSMSYFDSVFDKWKSMNFLNDIFFVGTLGLVVAKKQIGDYDSK